MADALTTITKLINSPPGQLVAGGVLAGIVWKFFGRVEAVLNENTKLEIAVWLLGVKASEQVEAWSSTFLEMFNRVFGEAHPSKVGFQRYFVATFAATVIRFIISLPRFGFQGLYLGISSTFLMRFIVPLALCSVLLGWTLILSGYLALCSVRWIIVRTSNYKHGRMLATVLSTAWSILVGIALVLLLTDVALSIMYYLINRMPLASIPPQLSSYLQTHRKHWSSIAAMTFYEWLVALLAMLPLFLGTLWLDLYAISGSLLKAARRFDIGFGWFNRKFDIETKPLQSIGLVAGALVAVVYWAAVIVSRVN